MLEGKDSMAFSDGLLVVVGYFYRARYVCYWRYCLEKESGNLAG